MGFLPGPYPSRKRSILPGMTNKPSVSLVAVAGRRRATLELAQRLEQEGFGGIYCPSLGDGLALCEALALATREIPSAPASPTSTRVTRSTTRRPPP